MSKGLGALGLKGLKPACYCTLLYSNPEVHITTYNGQVNE